MNKLFVDKTWDYFRTVHGIGLRAVAALPANQLDSHPIAGMRTPKELVHHLYQNIRVMAEGVARGELAMPDDAAIAAEVAAIRTRDDLLAYCRKAWEAGNTAVQGLTDAQIQGMVKTPWQDFPGFVLLDILYNEYWHHRGQLYTYLRALGVEPPMLYDFEHNEPGLRQKEAAGA